MQAQEFIQLLSRDLKLPDLVLDKTNVCRVLFDGHAIDFETVTGKDIIYFMAEIAPIPRENKEACYQRLLEGNLYGLETLNAVLSIDHNRDSLILHKFLDISAMSYQNVLLSLGEFFERLKFWKNVCADQAWAHKQEQADLSMLFLRV